MIELPELFRSAIIDLPPAFYYQHIRLWHPEHQQRMAEQILTASLTSLPEAFRVIQQQWQNQPSRPEQLRQLREDLRTAILDAGCPGLLQLLGQVRLERSLTDPRGIPPTSQELLAAGLRPAVQGAEPSWTVAAATLPSRQLRQLQPEAEGNHSWIATLAREWLTRLAHRRDGWSVIDHPQHGTVFIAWVSSGQAAIWSATGEQFLGWLDPPVPSSFASHSQ